MAGPILVRRQHIPVLVMVEVWWLAQGFITRYGVCSISSNGNLWVRLFNYRGRQRRRRISYKFRRRAFYGTLCSSLQRSSAKRLCLKMQRTMEIREGRGVAVDGDHIHLNLSHLLSRSTFGTTSWYFGKRVIFAGVDVTKEPIPVLPTVHYNMGGIPHQLLG